MITRQLNIKIGVIIRFHAKPSTSKQTYFAFSKKNIAVYIAMFFHVKFRYPTFNQSFINKINIVQNRKNEQ